MDFLNKKYSYIIININFLLFTVPLIFILPRPSVLSYRWNAKGGMETAEGEGERDRERERGEKNLSSSKEDFAESGVVVLFEETERD